MKTLAASAVVAALVSILAIYSYESTRNEGAAVEPSAVDPASDAAGDAVTQTVRLRYTDALVEDVWIDASRTAGDDHRSLTDAASSICFITKIEISGIGSSADSSSCAVSIDDFTGYWDLVATVDEGGQAQIRCNARCLVWE